MAISFINSFLSYLLVFGIHVVGVLAMVFLGVYLKKRKNQTDTTISSN